MYDKNSNKGRTRSWVKMLTRTFVSIIWKTVEKWQSQCQIVWWWPLLWPVMGRVLISKVQDCGRRNFTRITTTSHCRMDSKFFLASKLGTTLGFILLYIFLTKNSEFTTNWSELHWWTHWPSCILVQFSLSLNGLWSTKHNSNYLRRLKRGLCK